ncbi:hypothetical protein [Nostoc sp.]
MHRIKRLKLHARQGTYPMQPHIDLVLPGKKQGISKLLLLITGKRSH